MANRWGNNGNSDRFFLLGSKNTTDGDCSHEIKRLLLLRRRAMINLDSIFKKQRHYFANKGPSSQSFGFSSSHVWMWEQDYKESWALKNWCFWTVMLEKTFENPLDCKEIQPVQPKGDQPWVFFGRNSDHLSLSSPRIMLGHFSQNFPLPLTFPLSNCPSTDSLFAPWL